MRSWAATKVSGRTPSTPPKHHRFRPPQNRTPFEAIRGWAKLPTAMRAGLHRAYVRLALPAASGPDLAAACGAFRAALVAAWRLPCSNSLKEPLWRMAINVIPGSRTPAWGCPCCPARLLTSTSRRHSFWDCPVAAAVRAQLAMGLGETAVTPASLWLLRPPRHGLCSPAWTLVCLAALEAMEYGRRYLWALSVGTSWPIPSASALAVLRAALPQHIISSCLAPHFVAGRAAAVAAVGRAAATRFWFNLSDFADAYPDGPPRALVAAGLGPGHPFLAVVADRLVVRLPPVA